MFFNKPVMFSNFSKQNYGFNANQQKRRCDNEERREKILAGITHSKKSFGNLKTEKKTNTKETYNFESASLFTQKSDC